MNRAPSPGDRWWNDHQLSCGGSYTKVKEPEGYGKKTRKTKVDGDAKNKSKSSRDIKEMLKGRDGGEKDSKTRGKSGSGVVRKIFSGEGHKLASENSPQPKSAGERRQQLLEAVEKRRKLAESKGMKRKSAGGLSGDLRQFYPSLSSPSQAGEKRSRLDALSPHSNGLVATTSSSNSPSSSRDSPSILPHQNSPSGSSYSGTQRECVVDSGSDERGSVIVIDSDDEDDGGGNGDGVPVGMCPVCGRVDIPSDVINSHVTHCLDDDQ